MKCFILSAWRSLTSVKQPKRRGAGAKRTLRLENLEDRFTPAGISLAAGVITIDGTSKADVVKVELLANDPESILDDRYRVSISNTSGSLALFYDRFKPGDVCLLYTSDAADE